MISNDLLTALALLLMSREGEQIPGILRGIHAVYRVDPASATTYSAGIGIPRSLPAARVAFRRGLMHSNLAAY